MLDTLTSKELEVYKYLLKGYDYFSIADALNVKRSTIDTHILHLYNKLLVSSRAELMVRRIEELEKEVEELKRTQCVTRA